VWQGAMRSGSSSVGAEAVQAGGGGEAEACAAKERALSVNSVRCLRWWAPKMRQAHVQPDAPPRTGRRQDASAGWRARRSVRDVVQKTFEYASPIEEPPWTLIATNRRQSVDTPNRTRHETSPSRRHVLCVNVNRCGPPMRRHRHGPRAPAAESRRHSGRKRNGSGWRQREVWRSACLSA